MYTPETQHPLAFSTQASFISGGEIGIYARNNSPFLEVSGGVFDSTFEKVASPTFVRRHAHLRVFLIALDKIRNLGQWG